MNPLILSLICLVIVGITANLIKLIKESKILLQLSILPCVYLVIYGCYLIFGPIDLYKDGTENFFNQNPNKELPIVFVLLKFYQYILVLVGILFGYLYFYYLSQINKDKNNLNT